MQIRMIRKEEYRMISRIMTVILVIMSVATAFAADEVALKTEKDKLSYSIGLDIGSKLKSQSIDVDPEVVAEGIKDGFGGGKTVISMEEASKIMNAFQRERMEEQEKLRKQQADMNIKEGDLFLAKNRDKKGVKTTGSGLQYKVIKKGEGKTPKANDSVTVNYRGTLIDGTEFDSSYKRGQPATFNVSAVIKGWTEALQMMKEGAKWELYIPSDLGYGERGAGRLIGPNSVLIFEVELIKVN